jgi:hypothetical protein
MPNHYSRIVVPDTPASALTSSSYLRLGAYNSGESGIVTGLTTTTSSNSSKNIDAISGAKTDGVFSTTGQKTSEVTTTTTGTHTTDNAGVLAFTSKDFQANVKGAALMKIGNGHTTQIDAGDAKYTVSQGIYKISAENGVSITAGAGGTPANISMTASDYIKQTANGPLSEITFGNSEKRTIGNAMEFFLGTKFTCMIGATTTLTMAITTTMFIGAAFSFKLSFEFSLNAAASITIKFLATNSLTIGDKTDIVVGIDFKQVTGSSMKIVVGPDCKVALNDLKVLETMDLKFAASGDMKKVGLNGTVCEVDVKVTTGAALSKEEMEAKQKELSARMTSIESTAGQIQAVTKTAVLHL